MQDLAGPCLERHWRWVAGHNGSKFASDARLTAVQPGSVLSTLTRASANAWRNTARSPM